MKLKNINPILYLFVLGIFLEGLDAFSIYSIPVPWIGAVLIIGLYIVNYYFGSDFEFDELPSLRIWLFYLTIVTLVRAFSFNRSLPEYATTTFFEYISLRLVKLLTFITAIWLIHLFSKYFDKDKIIKYIAYAGLAISIFSLYSYFSYIFELPDFTRTRAGSGGWTQPIKRACSVLRNYGTFREPSFLAAWSAPLIPLFFYLAKKRRFWYLLSLIPIISIVLTRSLTGVISLLATFTIISLIWIVKKKSLNLSLLIPIVFILLASIFSNNIAYKFPALDPSMCPPESPDKCNCSIYEDKLDEAKNSESVTKSIFGRLTRITSGGLGAFENIGFLREYLSSQNLKIFGDGLGASNINYSYEFDEISKLEKEGQIIYRNPGQIVSFNNLYANLYLSSGLIGLIWFLKILFDITVKLIKRFNDLDIYLFAQFFIILLMYFFQAEEINLALALSIGLITINETHE